VDDVLRRIRDVVEFSDIDLVSVDQRGIFGNTPLVIVAGWGDAEAAMLLLDAGADVDAKGEDGETPLHRAIMFGHPEMVQLLFQKGASTAALDDDGLTPLEAALMEGDPAIVHMVRSAMGASDIL
jgi:ankyrin repeat protein